MGETQSIEKPLFEGFPPFQHQNACCEICLGPAYMGEQAVAASMTAIDVNHRNQLLLLSPALPMNLTATNTIVDWAETAVLAVESGPLTTSATLDERDRAQQYLDVAAVIMIVLDKDGKVSLLNQKGSEILGYSEESLLGQDWFTCCLPERVRHEVRTTFQQLMAGQLEIVEYYENLIVTHSGEERLIAWHNTLLTDDRGNVVGTLSSGTDITDRKRAEDALKQANDELERRVQERTAELTRANQKLTLFRRFIEASQQGFGMATLNGEITYVNPALSHLLAGGKPEDVIGRHVSCYYPPEHVRKREKEIIPSILQKGHWEGEITVSRHGQSVSLLQHSFLVRDEKNDPAYSAMVLTDITELKRAHETIQQEHRTLKHLLQASDHERQMIAYEIHDELAQQLAGAIMCFETFAHIKDANPQQADDTFEAAMTMLRNGHSETRRLIAGVRPPILDESGVVAAVSHLIHEQARLKGPTIQYRSHVVFDRLAPTVENAIYRIIQEGLANASQHSKSDRVRVSLVQRNDRIRIDLRDWGVGFDAESIQQNRFGLVGIRQRARLLGGKCSIRSKTGKGTRIAVELPVVESTPD